MKIRKGAILMLCSLCLTGCSGVRKLKINTEEITKDTIVSCNDQVIYEYDASYPDIASLVKDSDVIVYGKAEGIRYYIDWYGMCHTKADITVLRSLHSGITTTVQRCRKTRI